MMLGPLLAQHLPNFFGDERHHRMEQQENLIQQLAQKFSALRAATLASAPLSASLLISMYQSQNSCQVN